MCIKPKKWDRQGALAVLLLTERGFPQLGTSPITFKRILVFSTYLQSAVQTLINDSVIARGKSWQREGDSSPCLPSSLGARASFSSCKELDAPSPGLWLSPAITALEVLLVGSKCLHQ